MDEESSDGEVTFAAMARRFPVRTLIFSAGLPAFAVLQLLNGYLNGGRVAFIALFAAVTVAFAVAVTRYHLATFRRQRVTGRWEPAD